MFRTTMKDPAVEADARGGVNTSPFGSGDPTGRISNPGVDSVEESVATDLVAKLAEEEGKLGVMALPPLRPMTSVADTDDQSVVSELTLQANQSLFRGPLYPAADNILGPESAEFTVGPDLSKRMGPESDDRDRDGKAADMDLIKKQPATLKSTTKSYPPAKADESKISRVTNLNAKTADESKTALSRTDVKAEISTESKEQDKKAMKLPSQQDPTQKPNQQQISLAILQPLPSPTRAASVASVPGAHAENGQGGVTTRRKGMPSPSLSSPRPEDNQEPSPRVNVSQQDEDSILDGTQPLPLQRADPDPILSGAHPGRSFSALDISGNSLSIHPDSAQQPTLPSCGDIEDGMPEDYASTRSMSMGATSIAGMSIGADSYMVEAHLVEEEEKKSEEEEPGDVIMAEPMNWRMRSKQLPLIAGVVVAVLVVVIVVLLVGRGDDDDSSSTADSESNNSAAAPSVTETGPCFQFSEELDEAVDAYLQDNSPNSEVAMEYGWPIGTWCTSELDNFAHVFNVKRSQDTQSEAFLTNLSCFTEDIGDWDMSNAQDLEEMFRGAKNLSASWGIQRWNTSNMKSLKALFMGTAWTEPYLDLGSWDVSSVHTMDQLFRWSTLTSANVSNWDVSNVVNIGQLAEGAGEFNEDISFWNTQSMQRMYRAFKGATSFQGDLSGWNTSSLVKMRWAFEDATLFNSDLSQWDVSRVDDMKQAFKQASSFNQDISAWNVSSVTDLLEMFHGASEFSQDLCAWGRLLPPEANTTGMFQGTSCPNTSDPVLPNGPFCFNCDAI